MVFTKKIDRARQWAGEKMGGEAKTTYSEEFKAMEAEMSLRHDTTDKLQKSTNTYLKWASKKCEASEDKERSPPGTYFGRTMATHGEVFSNDSELGNCLVALGRANERVANFQETYVVNVSAAWQVHLEQNAAMMKDYSSSRKKLESRRLAFDASSAKLSKARRDDFKIEEEVRVNRDKFEESEEDAFRRMQDIKESEVDTIASLTELLDAQLEFYERAAEEFRRVRSQWAEGAAVPQPSSRSPRSATRSRSNTARSWQEPTQDALYEDLEPTDQEVPRLPLRPSHHNRGAPPPPPTSSRPAFQRSTTFDGRLAPTPLSQPPPMPSLPLTRIQTDRATYNTRNRDDVYPGDDTSNYSRSGTGSPDYTDRSASPATSYGSLSRSTSTLALKKAPPPPPPVNRAKKPPPPPPSRKPSATLR